jgi:hypothetical protein
MRVDLCELFTEFSHDSHHYAALNMLQEQLSEELLDEDSDWIACFKAAPDVKPGNYNKNITSDNNSGIQPTQYDS